MRCKPNTTYTISQLLDTSYTFAVATSSVNDADSSEFSNIQQSNSSNIYSNRNYITITTNSSDKYICSLLYPHIILFLIAPASNSRPIEKITSTGQTIAGRSKQKSSNMALDPILTPATKLNVNATAETTKKKTECKYLDILAFISLGILSTPNKVDEIGFQIIILLV